MTWRVVYHPEFRSEVAILGLDVRRELLANIELLTEFGPQLGRPAADTLNGSRYPNMKELRVKVAGGEWRFAFAFDPRQQAIVLCGGDKVGVKERRFYRGLIAKADMRYAGWLEELRK